MKGIMFKPDMVRAIKVGNKTVTRRLTGLSEINKQPDKWVYEHQFNWRNQYDKTGTLSVVIKPRYQVNDIVYIKEAGVWDERVRMVAYRDNAPDNFTAKWQSPMFMPAWAARYFLKILDVRAERLQTINTIQHDEVLKEGYPFGYDVGSLDENPVVTFARYWDAINPKHPWSSNPWVWRIKFTRVERPKED